MEKKFINGPEIDWFNVPVESDPASEAIFSISPDGYGLQIIWVTGVKSTGRDPLIFGKFDQIFNWENFLSPFDKWKFGGFTKQPSQSQMSFRQSAFTDIPGEYLANEYQMTYMWANEFDFNVSIHSELRADLNVEWNPNITNVYVEQDDDSKYPPFYDVSLVSTFGIAWLWSEYKWIESVSKPSPPACDFCVELVAGKQWPTPANPDTIVSSSGPTGSNRRYSSQRKTNLMRREKLSLPKGMDKSSKKTIELRKTLESLSRSTQFQPTNGLALKSV